MPEMCDSHEDVLWVPVVPDCDLMMYLRAARSMAAFAGMCDGGSADDGCFAACRDDTTINAMDILHNSTYDTGRALQALVKNPVPPGIEKKWIEEEQKRFVKGLRQYGKNFFKIRKELLPQKETGDLVEFYYLWKKTPAAATNRPHRRHRRQNILKKVRGGSRASRPQSNEFVDMSSASEEENDSDESDDVNGYYCHHCSTTSSKEWHPSGKDRAHLCTECCNFYKKFGELRPLPEKRDPPSFFFKPVKDEESPDGKQGVRTRRSKEGVRQLINADTKKSSRYPTSRTATPEIADSPISASGIASAMGKGRRSPSTWSTCSTSSTDHPESGSKKIEFDSVPPSRKRTNDERASEAEPDEETQSKKKKNRERAVSPTESVMSESGSLSNEENGHDGDNEQDGLSFPSSPSIRSPSPVDSDSQKVKATPIAPVQPAAIVAPTLPPPTPSVIPEQQAEPEPPLEQPPVLPSPPPIHIKIASPVPQEIPPQEDRPPPLPLPQPPISLSPELQLPLPPIPPPPPPPPVSVPIAPPRPITPIVPEAPIKQEEPQGPIFCSSFPPSIPVLLPANMHRPPSPRSPSPAPAHQPVTYTSLPLSRSSRDPSPLPYMKHHSIMTGTPLCPPPISPQNLSYPPIQRSPQHQASRLRSPVGFSGMEPPPAHSLSHSHHHSYPQHPRPPLPELQSPVMSRPPSVGRISPMMAVPLAASTVSPMQMSPLGLCPPLPLTQSSAPLSLTTSPVVEVPRIEPEMEVEEEEEPPTAERGPSPEPRVEDTECHRSESAIFLRHWNRGEYNSCCRTDLTFKPVPDSKLARKREERLRKQAEKEKEEREKAAKRMSTPERKTPVDPKCGPQALGMDAQVHHGNPYERCNPRGYPAHDTPALRQLSEYARPHTGFSPNMQRSMQGGMAIGPHPIDPMLHYQLYHGSFPPGARERVEFEMEREKREQEMIREQREIQMRDRMMLQDKMKEFKEMEVKRLGLPPGGSNPLENHFLEMQRRYSSMPNGPGMVGIHPGPFGLYPAAGQAQVAYLERERMERLGLVAHVAQQEGNYSGPVERLSAERLHAERMALATDPMLRLQMAGITPELHTHTHAHTHAHAHTHLHLHPGHDMPPGIGPHQQQPPPGHVLGPGAQNNPSGSGEPQPILPPGMYPRPGFMSREQALMHSASAGMLGRQYEDQLVHQMNAHAHEQYRRQVMMDPDRYPPPGAQLHPSLLAQHEEYMRQQQQREREMKIRTLEEAARGGRPFDHLPPGEKR